MSFKVGYKICKRSFFALSFIANLSHQINRNDRFRDHHSYHFFGRSLDVLDQLELVLVLLAVVLDLFEGQVDDGHHHVDQDHVDHDLKFEIRNRNKN